jgi:ATP-binding cassette subfamily F protein 3
MLVAQFDQVSKRFGQQIILDKASFQINDGDKIGLIGANGSGKTTLLNMMMEREDANEGNITMPKGVRVGYVQQYTEFSDEDTVLDCVLREHIELNLQLEAQEEKLSHLEGDELTSALNEYETMRQRYDRIDGDRFPQKAKAMLDSLGLAGRDHDRVSVLSGGEKNVLSMTQALLAEPELLVLDEPGNHLDYLGLAWLEDFLRRFKGAVFMVSHNRYLLDRVVDQILHLEAGQIDSYSGNYSAYRIEHLRRLVTQQAAFAADQKKLARLEEQVKRLKDTARVLGDKASGQRYRAMVSRFEREQAQATDKPVISEVGVQAAFSTKASKADIALEIKGYHKRFDDKILFENASLTIKAGERIALVGPNGSGKTTLIRDVIAHGDWEHDVIRIGPSLDVGYASQQQEHLREDRSVMDELLSVGGLTRDDATRILARFLFDWEELHKHIEDLSGGERNRLQLAQLMVKQPNFLILDEPTNHLDIQTCEAVEEALAEYDGTLLIISHDRYFLDNLVDRVIEVSNKKLNVFEGNFSAFWQRRQMQSKPSVGRVTKRRKQRENTFKTEQKAQALQDLEQRIETAESEKEQLESAIASAFTKGNHQEGRRLTNRLNTLKSKLDDLYQQWVDHGGS